MRRLIQQPCDAKVLTALKNRRAKVAAGDKVGPHWKSFTGLVAYDSLRQCLMAPLGARRRCSYCSDSKAADVEHFRPKEDFPDHAFEFDNFLLVCPECNRKKNAQFPVDSEGRPLMINPLFDDPWDSLFFSPTTGYLDAKLTHPDGTRAPKGEATLRVLGSILNGDAALVGRSRAWTDVVQRLTDVLDGTYPIGATQFEIFEDVDEYGLSEWLLNREGKELPEIQDVRATAPGAWKILRDLPRGP